MLLTLLSLILELLFPGFKHGGDEPLVGNAEKNGSSKTAPKELVDLVRARDIDIAGFCVVAELSWKIHSDQEDHQDEGANDEEPEVDGLQDVVDGAERAVGGPDEHGVKETASDALSKDGHH